MATAFDRWEKDPFFYAAEEVQESTDRMESSYRQWIHEKRAVELRREVHTSLGTAKWQLEELEKAVRCSDQSLAAGEDTVARHTDFVAAIRSKIFMVEKDLKESTLEKESDGLAWVRLDEGERDELAVFLSGSSVCSKKSEEIRGDKMKGHRRVASAFADLGVWKIEVDSEEECVAKLSNLPPPRILSLSELPKEESVVKSKWYRNGFRKWKVVSHEDMEESIPLQNHQLCRGMNACYEKSKSCLGDFTDDYSNKQLYGCLGACQRQIQRSQYQIQYGRSIHMIIWTAVTLMLIVFFVLRVT